MDLEPGTSDQLQLQLADIDLEADSPSPSKRAKRVVSLENQDMVQLFQSTISNSLDHHLGQIESSLAGIVQDQAAQASRMTRLETLAGNHQQELEDMRRSHTQRMDDLQAEIVQLQNFTNEPPFAQASPV